MGEVSDPYKELNKFKKKLKRKEPDIVDKDVGITTAAGRRKPPKKKKK